MGFHKVYITDLHIAMMHCSVHHFTDDANLLMDKSLKKITNILTMT